MDHLIQIDSLRGAAWESRVVARLLELGGRPVDDDAGRTFAFAGASARDEALDRVRGEFGWMAASPVDRG